MLKEKERKGLKINALPRQFYLEIFDEYKNQLSEKKKSIWIVFKRFFQMLNLLIFS